MMFAELFCGTSTVATTRRLDRGKGVVTGRVGVARGLGGAEAPVCGSTHARDAGGDAAGPGEHAVIARLAATATIHDRSTRKI
jgi:hypothetical protein